MEWKFIYKYAHTHTQTTNQQTGIKTRAKADQKVHGFGKRVLLTHASHVDSGCVFNSFGRYAPTNTV